MFLVSPAAAGTVLIVPSSASSTMNRFNVETVQYKNVKFQVWDLGGQSSIRPYWRCYYPNTDAIIFVVDSADTDRMKTARIELMGMLEEEELAGATLLVLANKQDQEGALDEAGVRVIAVSG